MAEDLKFAWDAESGVFRNRVSAEVIPKDEPVMIFRARDVNALSTLEHYLSLVEDPHHVRAVSRMIGLFEAYRDMNPDRMKQPGITHDIDLGDMPENKPSEISFGEPPCDSGRMGI